MPRGVKRGSAIPNWMVGEAVEFLREHHCTVLSMVSKMYYESEHKTIEDWLRAERTTWGIRLISLLMQMRRRWEEEDIVLLQQSWVGIMASALKAENLVDSEPRKV